MLQYSNTTVFNTNARTIVNTVNCFGVMGAGIALEFKLRYPEMYLDYEKRCKEKKVTTEKPYLFQQSNDLMIMNFSTKKHWKDPSKMEWIESGLSYFAKNYKRANIQSVAFPKLGASHGKLDWEDVKDVMEKHLKDLDLDITICLDNEPAQGIEKEMLNMLSNLHDARLFPQLKIQPKIREKIIAALPLNRFFLLQKAKGVGKKSYEKIFTTLYQNVINKDTDKTETKKKVLTQLSLFED